MISFHTMLTSQLKEISETKQALGAKNTGYVFLVLDNPFLTENTTFKVKEDKVEEFVQNLASSLLPKMLKQNPNVRVYSEANEYLKTFEFVLGENNQITFKELQ